MPKIEKEEDLYAPVKSLLEASGYEVKAEVCSCDVIAVKEDVIVSVELKRSLNLDVILQAVQMQKTSELSFVAVPKPMRKEWNKRFVNICHLLRRLELGLILVSEKDKKYFAEIFIEPVPFKRELSIKRAQGKKKRLMAEFRERSGDYNVGGSTRKKKVTAYREQAIQIAVILENLGSVSTRELRKLGTHEKNTTKILHDNHYGWFERVSVGVYKLTSKGNEGLTEFAKVADLYRK